MLMRYICSNIYQVIYFCNSEKFLINSLSLLFSFRLLSTLLSLLKVNNYIKYIYKLLWNKSPAKCFEQFLQGAYGWGGAGPCTRTPVNRHTHTAENIAFPQVSWREVTITMECLRRENKSLDVLKQRGLSFEILHIELIRPK